MVCVGEQVEGLNTASCPHVEGTRHGGALGNLRQGQGCLPNTQHVIFAQHPGSLMRPQIRGHPQLGAVISRMRAQVKHCAVMRFFAGILGGAGIFWLRRFHEVCRDQVVQRGFAAERIGKFRAG